MNQTIRRYSKLLLIHALLLSSANSFAQCPQNIGFESGTFDGWQCSFGEVAANPATSRADISLTPSDATFDIHTMEKTQYPQVLDPYGGFPINCPNGSNYSIKLGNDLSKKKSAKGKLYVYDSFG
jgi:hypothetical protein